MSLFKRCLSLVNTQSGTRDGLTVYASAFAKYLDASGITHTDIRLPGVDLQAIMASQLKAHDALVIVGGDGTISSVVNVLASHHQQHQQEGSSVVASSGQPTPSIPLKPIVLVPCGLQNSIAHSLGLSSAQRTVSSIVVGRTIDIPVWVVLLNGKVVRWVCSYAAIGTYASIVARYQRLHHWSEEFIALPAPRMKLRAASLYTAMEHRHVPCDATLVCEPKSETSNTTVVMYKSPLRMLLMSQMPLQHKGVSLTPRASIRTNSLSTTVLTSEATRLREWHLLRREAMEGLLLEEDGLHALDGVSEVRVKLHTTDDDDPVLMMLDGEPLHLPSGAEVVVRRSGLSLPFLAC